MPTDKTSIKQYIKRHSNLFWYIPEDKKENISESLLVETILNYGETEDVVQLFNVVGIKEVAKIFFEATNRSERARGNYYPEIYNFFKEVFAHYA